MEHEKLPKVMEFCDELWNFTNFAPELYYQICALLLTRLEVTLQNLALVSEVRTFQLLLQNVANADYEQGGGHGK